MIYSLKNLVPPVFANPISVDEGWINTDPSIPQIPQNNFLNLSIGFLPNLLVVYWLELPILVFFWF